MTTQTNATIIETEIENDLNGIWQKPYKTWGKLPSKSLNDAAGMLKNKYKDLKRHYLKIRKEWPSYSK